MSLPLVVLLSLFLGSGCAALIYEIVWFQLLSLVIGSSALSLGVLLSTYMGGMCLGSLAFARMAPAAMHPLRVYALLESAIAVLALLILGGLPYAGGLYVAIGGHGALGLACRTALAGLCLVPPTMLMGATLPAVARWVENTPRGVSWPGLFYGANTAGAVIGSLLAGYCLLRVYDVFVATWVGVTINVAVAAAAWLLSALLPRTWSGEPHAEWRAGAAGSWPVYVAAALSGMTAMGAEVVWTRLLSLLLGATVYTFCLIVAVFLIGVAIGSAAGSLVARSADEARTAFGIVQILLVGAIFWAAYSLAMALPYWPIDPKLSTSPQFQFQVDFARGLWVVLPAACLWGASFPLALLSLADERRDLGRIVGSLYAANTVGGIVGALGTTVVLIPSFGTRQGERALIVATALAAAVILVPARSRGSGALRLEWKRTGAGAAGLALMGLVAAMVPTVPPELVAWGHNVATSKKSYGEIIFVGEGMNSSMAVSKTGGALNYHNAGKVQASTLPQDMRLQRMLGHLATLVPEHARDVLVIGCGAGVTAGSVSIDPVVVRETIAEIERLVPTRVATLFAGANFDVMSNPKVDIQIDDARHFVLTTERMFDAVTSDPFDPWVKGAASLYTREFFDLIKRHLKPGGVVTVFVQLYESTEEAVKSEVATFLDAFPNGMVFGNAPNGVGYDVVLLGQVEPTEIHIDDIEQRLSRPEYAKVKKSLGDIGFGSAAQLFATYAGRASELQPWLAGAQINRDRNLRLQYLAGLGMNLYDQAAIYSHMVRFRRYPENVFFGTSEDLRPLRAALRR